MSTVIIVTNLSAASQNALDYACAFMQGKPVRFVLLRVFAFSAGFAGDGVGVAALSEVSAHDQNVLDTEKERIQTLYPNVEVETRLVAGQFMEALQDEVAGEDVRLVVMGAEGDYNDLLSWDNHMVNAFVDLPVPVLMVPASVHFAGVKQIAFACNYKRDDLYGPVQTLRRLLHRLGSSLHFVHIQKEAGALQPDELEWKHKWEQELADERVTFEELGGDNVVAALDAFSTEKQIDLLAIRPHRAGIWASIFNRSNTRDITHLNTIPVLALRGGGM